MQDESHFCLSVLALDHHVEVIAGHEKLIDQLKVDHELKHDHMQELVEELKVRSSVCFGH